MKRLIISLSIIAAAGAIVAGGTYAFFYDTETSSGNVFTAGSIDLKVDHTSQTYNDMDCKTCQIVLISDETNNMVVEKNGAPIATPYNAVYAWTHSAWTAEEDPILEAAGAEWIWEHDPTRQEDTTTDVTYTFRNEFEWWGPVTGSDLYMAIGSDNSVEVWLNGVKIGENAGEFGYKKEYMLHIDADDITDNINQGDNVLEFVVKNWGMPNGTPTSNPAGLVYKFSIDGQCGDDFFKTSCTLFGVKDLDDGDHFWMFDDVKPGDHGTNVISLHVDSNDAYVCLLNADVDDEENECVETEQDAGDNPSSDEGELSGYINLFIWNDINGNGQYEPTGEADLYEGNFIPTEMTKLSLASGGVDNLGVAWCMGSQTVDHQTGTISCSGAGSQDDAQTDQLIADLVLYAVQQRNNGEFSCDQVDLNPQTQP